MTKHVSPEITGTELSTDYIRDIGGVKTLMCESKRFPGVFVGLREMSAEEVSEDTGPVVRETESFDDTIEVREDVTWKLVGLELGKHFETRGLHEDDGPKDDSPKDNKPRRRKPAGCRFPLRRPAHEIGRAHV